MSISVVIPTYNSGPLVTQAIDSVLAQTQRPAEIVVIDDGSTDDTHHRVAAYGIRVRYVYQPNAGVSEARNRGIREASGTHIALLDADDVWHPRKLELQLQVLREHNDIALLGTGLYAWPASEHPDLEPLAPCLPLEFVSWERLVVRNYFSASSVIFRKDLLARLGSFDASMSHAEDYDLWLRIAESYPVAVLRLPLMGYRDVAGSLSKQASAMVAGMDKVLRKLDARGGLRGRRSLRRKAKSYQYFSAAVMFKEAADRRSATWYVLRSLALHPLPYRRDEVKMPFHRIKTLLALLRSAAYSRLPPPTAKR